LLLSGARRNELLELKWDHIDQRTPACIWIRDKIEEAGRYVPLGAYSLWLLSTLPKRKYLPESSKKERDVEWVFSGPDIGNAHIHCDTPGAAHRRAITKVGLGVSLHGLRRSYASLAEWLEIPSGITAQIQGHKASAVQERHYKRRPLELLAQSHCRFEAWVLNEAGIEFDSDKIVSGLRVVR
jgi:integrase